MINWIVKNMYVRGPGLNRCQMQVTHLKTWHNHFLWGSLVQAQACKDVCKIDAHLKRVNVTGSGPMKCTW